MKNILSKDTIDILIENGIMKNYAVGDSIAKEKNSENSTAFLINGLSKVVMNTAHSSLLLYYAHESDYAMIAFMNIYENTRPKIDAISLSKTDVLWIDNCLLLKIASSLQELKSYMISTYEKNNQAILDKMQDLISTPPDERLLSYLITQSIVLKTETLHISRSEIASDMNISREFVSRILKDLEKKDFLSRQSRAIVLKKSSFLSKSKQQIPLYT